MSYTICGSNTFCLGKIPLDVLFVLLKSFPLTSACRLESQVHIEVYGFHLMTIQNSTVRVFFVLNKPVY